MAEEEKNTEELSEQEKLAQEWEQSVASEESGEEKAEEESVDQNAVADEWESMLEESGTEEQPAEEKPAEEDLAAQWEDIVSNQEKEEIEDVQDEKLKMIMDIPLEISVEIGSTSILLEEVLKLNPNSIVELDKFVSQPVDLKINGKLIAQGELYTIKNHFGIKITNIITPQERMKLLDELY